MLWLPDEDRCCSDPTWPHTLVWRCLHPKFAETPAPCHLPLRTPHCSSRVTWPSSNSAKESVDTSHSGWWTKTVKLNWMHTGHVEHTEQPITTNQDLVAWPRDIHVDTNGRQSELRPETVDELIASTQTQHFNEGWNLRHHPHIRVHSTSFVNNDVFCEWVLPVSHDQRNPHDLHSLALYLCWTHDVPLIVKHFPAWRPQPQTLIARKVFAALEVPQKLVMTMSQHRNVLATNSAVKMTGLCRNICRPSHKESPNVTRSPSSLHLVRLLRTSPLPWLTSITRITTRVSGVAQPRENAKWPLFHLLQSTQNII